MSNKDQQCGTSICGYASRQLLSRSKTVCQSTRDLASVPVREWLAEKCYVDAQYVFTMFPFFDPFLILSSRLNLLVSTIKIADQIWGLVLDFDFACDICIVLLGLCLKVMMSNKKHGQRTQ